MLIDDFKKKIAKYCAYQDRSHNQVRKKLQDLGLEPTEVDNYIVWLLEEGFLDESRFASAYTRGKFHQNKWGRNKIIYGLRSQDVSPYVIQQALGEIESEYEDQILYLVSKKWNQLGKAKDYKTRNKIYTYMIGKGYESELVLKVLDSL